MVNVLDFFAEQKSKQQFNTELNNARDQFVKQKSSIESISWTVWFKELVKYWEREVKACEARLATMKSEDIKSVQAELAVANRFLSFISNILSANIDL
jgi:hypothetical protein